MILRTWDLVDLHLLKGRDPAPASGVQFCCAASLRANASSYVCGSQVSSGDGNVLRAPRGEFGHEKWPSGEDRPFRSDGRIVRLGREAMGEVCVSATGITGAAAEVVAVDRGDDVGLTLGQWILQNFNTTTVLTTIGQSWICGPSRRNPK